LIFHFTFLNSITACNRFSELGVFFRDRPAGTSMWGFASHHPWFDTIPKEDT
jgi:hypothetical protein